MTRDEAWAAHKAKVAPGWYDIDYAAGFTAGWDAAKVDLPDRETLITATFQSVETLIEQLAAAQAVIAKAKSWNDHDTGEPTYWDLHHVLAQSPVDALAAHDRQVAAKAWDAGYWLGINGHTGPGNPHRDPGEKGATDVA